MTSSWNTVTPDPRRQNRVFGLDLVRAIAIGLVLAAHYGVVIPYWLGYKPLYPVATLGLLGVDLFFVLSGFLIGRLLIDVIRIAPSFGNLRIFLIRRWMRTVPLYVVWLCISLAFFPPPDHRLRHFIGYLTFTQNLVWPMPVSNWFGVSWSLAVEEWFYLLFGVCAVGAVLVRRSPKAALIPLALFCVIPAVLRWMVPDTANWDNDVTKIVILRLDSIAYGVILAYLRFAYPRLFAHPRICGTIGAAIIIATWAGGATMVPVLSYHALRTFTFNILDLGFALCIIGAVAWTTAGGWIAKVVRKISDISYGLYLMHLTILLACGNLLVHGLFPAVTAAVTIPIALSLLSWHFLETWVLKRRPRQTFTLLNVNERTATDAPASI
jgi:peptidoglycan/LPS O-acetylase OafA/YrhL